MAGVAHGLPADDAAASRPAGRALRAPLSTPLTTGVAVVGATAVLAVRTPYEAGSYGSCPLHSLTGWWCPLCGGLRATHDLAHGDVAAAWGMNPLWVVAVPFVVLTWALWLVRRRQGRALGAPPAWLRWSAVGVVLAFGVLRNVPALAPWLAP